MKKKLNVTDSILVGLTVGSAVALIAIAYKLDAVSATQDNILRTLNDAGIIQNLQIGK